MRLRNLLEVLLPQHSFTTFDTSDYSFKLGSVCNERGNSYDESAEVEIHFPWLVMKEDNAKLEQVYIALKEGGKPVADVLGQITFDPYSEKRAQELKKLASDRLLQVGKELDSLFSWRATIL